MAKNHYITLDGVNYIEIPLECLEDIEQLFKFLQEENNREYDRQKKLFAEGQTPSNYNIAFMATHSMINRSINQRFWIDGKGNTNPHIQEKVLKEVKQLERLNIRDIAEIVAINAIGKETYTELRSKDFTQAREWLAMPDSKELVKLCEQMGNGWKLEGKKTPLFALIVLYMIQAYINYEIFDIGKAEADEEFINAYSDLQELKAKADEIATDEKLFLKDQAAEKVNILLAYFKTMDEIAGKMEIATIVNVTAAKLSQMLRPTGEKIGKRKKGEAREAFIKSLEETIIYINERYKLPFTEQESVKPTGHAAKCWSIETGGTMELYEPAGQDPEQKEVFLMLPMPKEIKKYIFIDKRLLNLEGLEDFLINEARISAYYYIALKITEAWEAGKKETSVNLDTLLKLCGLEGDTKQNRERFKQDVIIGNEEKPGIDSLLNAEIKGFDCNISEDKKTLKLTISE